MEGKIGGVGKKSERDKVEGVRRLSWMVVIGWGLFGCGLLRFSFYPSYY